MKKFLPLAAAVLFSACTTNHGTYTILSTRNIDLEQLQNNSELIRDVEGRDTVHLIVFIPTKLNIDLSTAVTDALTKTGGDAMVNVQATHHWWWIPYIYGRAHWIVRGDVLKIKD